MSHLKGQYHCHCHRPSPSNGIVMCPHCRHLLCLPRPASSWRASGAPPQRRMGDQEGVQGPARGWGQLSRRAPCGKVRMGWCLGSPARAGRRATPSPLPNGGDPSLHGRCIPGCALDSQTYRILSSTVRIGPPFFTHSQPRSLLGPACRWRTANFWCQ